MQRSHRARQKPFEWFGEPEEYRATDLVILNSRLEAPPSSRDALFDVMSDRLGDLSHELAHGDFSDRRTLTTVREEAEMQRTLAARLRSMSNGAYEVVREDEVADQKKTDIRLLSVLGNQKAVIEVKIADKRWSMAELRKALASQLVGQYLRHETCKAGCLLLTNNGSRTIWRRTDNGRQLDFAGLIALLSDDAKTLERQQSFGIKLVVWGLDLTSPRSRRSHSKQPKSGRVKAGIRKGVIKPRSARRSR